MFTRIAVRLELFFLDIFIYVLSNSKWFQMLVRGFYAVTSDRQMLRQFICLCVMCAVIGFLLGWILIEIFEKARFLSL